MPEPAPKEKPTAKAADKLKGPKAKAKPKTKSKTVDQPKLNGAAVLNETAAIGSPLDAPSKTETKVSPKSKEKSSPDPQGTQGSKVTESKADAQTEPTESELKLKARLLV